MWKYVRVIEDPSQLVPLSTARLPKPGLFTCLILPRPFAAQEPALLPSTLGKLREGNWTGHAT